MNQLAKWSQRSRWRRGGSWEQALRAASEATSWSGIADKFATLDVELVLLLGQMTAGRIPPQPDGQNFHSASRAELIARQGSGGRPSEHQVGDHIPQAARLLASGALNISVVSSTLSTTRRALSSDLAGPTTTTTTIALAPKESRARRTQLSQDGGRELANKRTGTPVK